MSEREIEDAGMFDGQAIEDLLDGTGGDDAAEAFLPLVPFVAAARRPPLPAELAGEAEAMAVYRQLRTRPVAPSRVHRSRRFGIRLIAIAGAVTVASATGAAAAAGGLPGPVQDTAATLLGTVGISVPGSGGVPAGPPAPPPATTTTPSPSTATAITVTETDTSVETEAPPPMTTEVTVAATAASAAPAPEPPRAEPGPRDDVVDTEAGKGEPAKADDAAATKDDSPGKAKGQDGDHTPPGQAGKDHEPGAGAAKPKPPKPPKEKAAAAARP